MADFTQRGSIKGGSDVPDDQMPLYVTRPAKLFEGWLTKKGSIIPSWKKRFFILRRGYLNYYKGEVEDMEVGEEGGLKGQALFGASVEYPDESSNRFRIRSREYTLDLRTEDGNATAAGLWVRMLRQEIDACNLDFIASGKSSPEVSEFIAKAREANESAMVMLSTPMTFTKYFQNLMGSTVSHPKLINVHVGSMTIEWRDPDDASASPKHIAVADIESIVVDPDLPPIFEVEPGSPEAECCFTLTAKGRDLHLQAEDKAVRDQWIAAMECILKWGKVTAARETANRPKVAASTTRLKSILQAQHSR